MAECRCNGCRMLGREQARQWPRWENVREEEEGEERRRAIVEEQEMEVERMRERMQQQVAVNTTTGSMYHWYTGTIGATTNVTVSAPLYNTTIQDLEDPNEYFIPQGGTTVNPPAVPTLGRDLTWGELTRNGGEPEWRAR